MARTPIHPGEHLAEELNELGLSAAELARQIEVPVNRITGIINGQRGVTAETALRLGHWLGTSPEFWLNLQTLYELRLAPETPAIACENFRRCAHAGAGTILSPLARRVGISPVRAWCRNVTSRGRNAHAVRSPRKNSLIIRSLRRQAQTARAEWSGPSRSRP